MRLSALRLPFLGRFLAMALAKLGRAGVARTGLLFHLSPRAGRGEKAIPFSRRLRARVLPKPLPKTSLKKGGGAPKGASNHCPRHTSKRCRLNVRGRGSGLCASPLAFRSSTAALAKGFHPWLGPVPRFMVADNRSAPRAASSWQTGVVAGRASFRTARGRGYEPHPGHRPRSINRPSPVDVPWMSEMYFLYFVARRATRKFRRPEPSL